MPLSWLRGGDDEVISGSIQPQIAWARVGSAVQAASLVGIRGPAPSHVLDDLFARSWRRVPFGLAKTSRPVAAEQEESDAENDLPHDGTIGPLTTFKQPAHGAHIPTNQPGDQQERPGGES